MAAPDLPTVELAGKRLPCYWEGEEAFVLYSSLMKEFQLAVNVSPSTQQRRKNRVAGTDQHCPSGHLQCMKDAGVVAKAARNVAVLTIRQAHNLLQLYNVPGEAEMVDKGVELNPDPEELKSDTTTSVCHPQPQQHASASGGSTECLVIEDPDHEQPGPPPPKTPRLARSMQLDLELNPDAGRQLKELASFWTKELNHIRGAQALSKSTMDKTQERLLSELAVGQVDAYCTYSMISVLVDTLSKL